MPRLFLAGEKRKNTGTHEFPRCGELRVVVCAGEVDPKLMKGT